MDPDRGCILISLLQLMSTSESPSVAQRWPITRMYSSWCAQTKCTPYFDAYPADLWKALLLLGSCLMLHHMTAFPCTGMDLAVAE